MKMRVPKELEYVRDRQKHSIPVVGDNEDPTELEQGSDPDVDETVLSKAADAFDKKRDRLEGELLKEFRAQKGRKGARA